MKRNTILENTLKAYIEKQKKFKVLIKKIQKSIQSKEYKQYNCPFDEFIKKKWKISKAQAYRYLISAKVIDQLEDFEIQPCYERICRSIYSYAKTPTQMKLLWGSILQNAGNRPDCINSSHVTRTWKKLCSDERYSKICHYEDEIITKVEKSIKRGTKSIKRKQLPNKETKETKNISSTTQINQINKNSTPSNTVINNNEYQYVSSNNSISNSSNSHFPSPTSSICSPIVKNESQSPEFNQDNSNVQNITYTSTVNILNPVNTIEYSIINNPSDVKNIVVIPPVNSVNQTTTNIQPQQQTVEYRQVLQNYQVTQTQIQTVPQAQTQQPQQIIYYY
ncbi:hypothetical protein H8356DRAFT_1295352 [Neocallimastix lanati (nom. inval.)]|uniref:Uncharacterized protein n=1 Tax=Neocallimastix californiae TaxID=1754190 RepID=A0A1Y2AP30_9FUNG|nr:hypothetical protein H8356DRAFT_1295352 [Neocallimastix sp. JGI-2020a]ORY24323.1 hypothetical protein LY90DRAFT_675216 [Neocallimastix californiae]|eukprot:ORY24323.1 hypothetical protein LY90DRAFT_675216 [Neocallimastix californiae]